MKKYEYKFIKVPRKGGLQVKNGDTFEACKEVILTEAGQGWRLKQIVTPFCEKTGVFTSDCYEIILEREV